MSGTIESQPAKSVTLAALRRRIAALEAPAAARAVIPLGVAALDHALPWRGLPSSALHEIDGALGDAAAVAFAARIAAAAGTTLSATAVLWCQLRANAQERGLPYPPGLAAMGLKPRQVMFVACRSAKDAAWAMEEGLRAGVFAAVVGDGVDPGITAARRLQLAAGDGPAIALMLPPATSAVRSGASFALTRWHVTAAPTTADDAFLTGRAWRVELVHCRGAPPGAWRIDWPMDDVINSESGSKEKPDAAFSGAVATALADRPVAAHAAIRRAG